MKAEESQAVRQLAEVGEEDDDEDEDLTTTTTPMNDDDDEEDDDEDDDEDRLKRMQACELGRRRADARATAKILGRAAGVSSRRQAEQLMLEGRVTVNGAVVRELGVKVDPAKDAVKVDGKRVLGETPAYVLLFKPKGTICTLDDPEDRPTVVDLVKGLKTRLYPVGRLDFDTTGALLLTNDGELANLLMHPRHRFTKTYVAKVKGIPTDERLDKLRRGVNIEGHTAPAEARILQVKEKNSVIQLTLREGRNKQVKRMCQAIGHPVIRLHRSAYGFLTLEGLEPTQWRTLSEDEVKRLRAAASRAAEGTDEAPSFKPKIEQAPARAPRQAPRSGGRAPPGPAGPRAAPAARPPRGPQRPALGPAPAPAAPAQRQDRVPAAQAPPDPAPPAPVPVRAPAPAPARRSSSGPRPKRWAPFRRAQAQGPSVKSLKPLRRRIDSLDDQILGLLNERAKVVQKVYDVKVHHAQGSPAAGLCAGPGSRDPAAPEGQERRALPAGRHRAGLQRDHLRPAARWRSARASPTSARPAPTPTRPPSSASAPRATMPASPASRASLKRWSRSAATTAWCRWRTAPKASSTTPSTSSSIRTSRSAPRSRWPSAITCCRPRAT